MSVGPESSTTGPDFATEGPDTGGGVLSTYHSRHLGVSCPYGGPTTTLLNMAENLGVTWVRFSTEITDLYSTPDNTSNPGTLTTSGVAAQIAAVHARTGADGNPMRVILDVMGVTRQVNPNSGSADPDTGGGHGHWFATDSTGRGRVAAWTVALANLLDPAVDCIELGNEFNNAAFNHNGGTTNNTGEAVGASASVVAAQMLAQIDAVRASGPAGLPIMSGAIMSFGNWRNATDVAGGLTGPDWLAAMVAAQPTLASTHQPDIWSYHDYVNYLDVLPQDGVLVVNGDLALGGSPAGSGNPGWGTSQMIRFRDVLNFVGATDPNDGSAAKIAITEWGASYTAGPYAATPTGQDLRVGQHLFNYEVAFNAGWMPITTYYNDAPGDDKALFTSSSTGSITTAGARIRTLAHQTDSTVTTNPPVAAIGASPLRPVAGQSVQFTDASTGGAGTSWVWGFGDGGFSASQNPTHTFAAAGTYLVQLTVTNADGNSSASVNFTVAPVITPPPPPPTTVVLVELGVPPTATNTPSAFEVGDAIRGKLGSPYFYPDRYTYFPISGDVQSVDIRRGRNRPLDRTDAGTASIVVRNDRTDRGTAANYDPYNWLSPYFPYIGPRARIRVSVDGKVVYTGDIADVPIEDVTNNIVTTTFNCVDMIGRLNRPVTYIPEAQHSAQKRISRLLEISGNDEPTFLTPGAFTFQSGFEQTGSLLDQIQDVSVGDGGMFFCNASGTFVYLSRAGLVNASPQATYSDDASREIRYSAITRNIGLDLVYNSATIRGVRGDTLDPPQAAHDDPSITLYGEIAYDATLPLASNTDRAFRAQQVVNDYKTPLLRFETVTIPAHRYTATQRKTLICNRELGDVVTVERVPPGGPVYGATGGVLSLVHNIIGIEMRLNAAEKSCWVTFTLSRQVGH